MSCVQNPELVSRRVGIKIVNTKTPSEIKTLLCKATIASITSKQPHPYVVQHFQVFTLHQHKRGCFIMEKSPDDQFN